MKALCDVNNFYVSCERVFDPALNNRPCIVNSNNDGCAIAHSNEVKDLGIKMGDPIFKIKDLIKTHDNKVLSSNFALYGDLSSRVDDIMSAYSDQLEWYSIDESFLRVRGFEHLNYIDQMQQMVKRIQRWIGLPVCVGIAPSKTLAKVANHWAKKLKIPGSVLQLDNPFHIKEALKHLPVSEIWGVGRQLTCHLAKMNIYTALDLYNADAKLIRKRFSVALERTVYELRDISCIEFDAAPEKKKQIICSRSMGTKTESFDVLTQELESHVSRGAEKLRKQQSVARSLTVAIKTNPFSNVYQQHTKSITLRLPEHTDQTLAFLKAARHGLTRIYRKNFEYKKTGVIFQDICDSSQIQSNLFDSLPTKYIKPELMGVTDQINERFGKGKLRSCTEGFIKPGKMKQNSLSPSYTTKISDLIRVK